MLIIRHCHKSYTVKYIIHTSNWFKTGEKFLCRFARFYGSSKASSLVHARFTSNSSTFTIEGYISKCRWPGKETLLFFLNGKARFEADIWCGHTCARHATCSTNTIFTTHYSTHTVRKCGFKCQCMYWQWRQHLKGSTWLHGSRLIHANTWCSRTSVVQ